MPRLLRIFVSSPGDCAAEREIVEEVVQRVNQTDSDRTGLILRTLRWERDVVPRIGPPPQDVIDEQTPACEIFVGIMSARFGGDGDRESGTEHELRVALDRFAECGRPWVMFYFNNNPTVEFKKQAALLEWARVIEFRAELENKGIAGTYTGVRGSKEGFFETFEQDIRGCLREIERGLLRQTEADAPCAAGHSNAAERHGVRPAGRDSSTAPARHSPFAVSPDAFLPAAVGGVACALFAWSARRVESDFARVILDLLAVVTLFPVGYAIGRRSSDAPKWTALVSAVMIGAASALAAYVGTEAQSRVAWGTVVLAFGIVGPLLAFVGQVVAARKRPRGRNE